VIDIGVVGNQLPNDAQITLASSRPGLGTSPAQGGQENAYQQCDDPNNHQQLS
jgi:hypothetical protein